MRVFLTCGTAGFAAANELVGKSDVEMEPGKFPASDIAERDLWNF